MKLRIIIVALLAVASLARAEDHQQQEHHASIFGFAASIPHVAPWGNGASLEFQDESRPTSRYVLLQNPDYANGLGLEIQIQTRNKDFYSYIEAAVLRVGSQTIEVRGGDQGGQVWVNGKDETVSASLREDGSLLQRDGLFLEHALVRQLNDKQFQMTAELLGGASTIKFETFQNFIRVDIDTHSDQDFTGSFGLMGSFPEGVRIARDQSTIMKSDQKFAKEWSVQDQDDGDYIIEAENLFLSESTQRSAAVHASS